MPGVLYILYEIVYIYIYIYIMSMSTSCPEKKTSQRDSFLIHVRLKEKEFDNSVTAVLEIISAANKSVQHPMIMRY